MSDDRTIKTSLYIPRGLLKRLKDASFEDGSTVNAVVVHAAESWLSKRTFFGQAADVSRSAAETVTAILERNSEKHAHFGINGKPDDVIESSNRVTSIPKEFQRWVLYLLHILEADNPYASPSIKKNLEAFARLTELDGGQHAPPTGEPEGSQPHGGPSADRTLQEAVDIRRDATRIDKEHQTKRRTRRKNA